MIFAIPIAFATVATGVALLAAERARLGTGKVKKIAVREARKGQRARSRADKAETRARKSESRERKTEREARKRRRRKKRKAFKIPSHKIRLKAEDARPREREPEKEPRKTTRIRPKKYAEQLYVYVSRMIAAGKASQLGTKGKHNPEVKRLQGGMRRIKKDGIYGTRTRRRGKELTGKSFPRRRTVKPAERKPFTPPEPTQPPPKPTTLRETDLQELPEAEAPLARGSKRAALDLLLYARGIGKTSAERSKAFGYKDHSNQTVEDAQRDMGGLKVDGIYGRKTRRRGKELTGQRFPIR